ncbi:MULTISPECIES: hypothetical protein [unclassified Shinella]|uniref:hypothetical protein n=1 Tax=unclassified Shinella TaxID=2643062 RepID=UPI00102D469C|nr:MULTISPECIES: hypothetical protein [unclassified Shinella]MCO5154489.1 hypothetical protein [Shinella sp.]MDC7264383.1 hypothetical protein [Shinella sp. HY16]MDC7271279.1 hypothetical protein [Shinella sp. YZ44]MDG4675909.1 hypothetical protein [Shinella sp. 838]TAA53061.1 hypothetical protein EXZ48_29275 [Shinella sp. JR1-6]
MSSGAGISEISSREMVRSALRMAGYSPDALAENGQKFNTATKLLMRLVHSGKASPHRLMEQLERSFGRPLKYKVLFAPLRPRHAIQGLPLICKAEFRPVSVPLRSGENDLQGWENEGGAPNHASHNKSVHR